MRLLIQRIANPITFITAVIAVTIPINTTYAAPTKAMQKTWTCFSGRGNLTVTIGSTKATAKWSNGVVGVVTIEGSGDEIKVTYSAFKRGSKKVSGGRTDTYTLLASGKIKAKTRGLNFRRANKGIVMGIFVKTAMVASALLFGVVGTAQAKTVTIRIAILDAGWSSAPSHGWAGVADWQRTGRNQSKAQPRGHSAPTYEFSSGELQGIVMLDKLLIRILIYKTNQ